LTSRPGLHGGHSSGSFDTRAARRLALVESWRARRYIVVHCGRLECRTRHLSHILDLLAEDSRTNVYRGELELLRSRVLGAIESVTPTVQSFQLRLGSAVTAQDVVEWMALEHQCCPFLTTAITIRPDGTRWVELGGSAAIKDFLREEFSTVLR
jgi:hypothetical protein